MAQFKDTPKDTSMRENRDIERDNSKFRESRESTEHEAPSRLQELSMREFERKNALEKEEKYIIANNTNIEASKNTSYSIVKTQGILGLGISDIKREIEDMKNTSPIAGNHLESSAKNSSYWEFARKNALSKEELHDLRATISSISPYKDAISTATGYYGDRLSSKGIGIGYVMSTGAKKFAHADKIADGLEYINYKTKGDEENANKKLNSIAGGVVGGAVLGTLGGVVAGPLGAAVGSVIGSAIGQYIGDLFSSANHKNDYLVSNYKDTSSNSENLLITTGNIQIASLKQSISLKHSMSSFEKTKVTLTGNSDIILSGYSLDHNKL